MSTLRFGLFCHGHSAGFFADGPQEFFSLGLEAFSLVSSDLFPEDKQTLPRPALLMVKLSILDRTAIPSLPFQRYHHLSEILFQSFNEVAEWLDESAMTLYTRGLEITAAQGNQLEVSAK